MVARSSPISAVTQPCQLPASSLTSTTCFSPATPSSGDNANIAATTRARRIFIVDPSPLPGRAGRVGRARRFDFLSRLQLELRGLLDRQVAGLCSFEDSIDVGTFGACCPPAAGGTASVPSVSLRSEEHTSELQSRGHLV